MKRNLTISVVLLLLVLLGSMLVVSAATTAPIANKSTDVPEVSSAPEPIVVYITRTGEKYHRGTCSYLKSSKIAVTLQEAVSRGFTPCSRCNPPRLTSVK